MDNCGVCLRIGGSLERRFETSIPGDQWTWSAVKIGVDGVMTGGGASWVC